MRRFALFLLLAGLCAPARAQVGPGFPQFAQPGIGIGAVDFALPPGQAGRVLAYCGSLLSDTPTQRDLYLPGDRSGVVMLPDGSQLALRQAVQNGLVAIRGAGPGDPAHPPRSLSIPLYVVNRAPFPVTVAVAAGAPFQPQGQSAPAEPALRMAAALSRAGMAGTDVACLATWAATGSTRADLEHALARIVSDREAQAVSRILTQTGAGRELPEGREDYPALYEKALKKLGEKTLQSERSVRFPSGLIATVTATRGPETQGLAKALTREGQTLHYGAEISDGAAGGWRVRLLNLKTGRPLPAMPDFTFEAPKG